MKRYTIHRAKTPPSLDAVPGKPAPGWDHAETGAIQNWHRASGPVRPATLFRALYDTRNIYVRFDVLDSFVRAVHTRPNSAVCEDSCVEFFIQPPAGRTYFNFEISAIGTMLLYRIADPRRVEVNGRSGFADFAPVPPEWAGQVEIHTSLKGPVRKPITQPIAWVVAYRIPLALFTASLGVCSAGRGDVWRGNFFKCGGSDHWGMWCDVGRMLNFHQPSKFGEIVFD